MKRNSILFVSILIILLAGSGKSGAQVLVESVAAIVGNEVVFLSDIENAVMEYRRSGTRMTIEELRCNVLREALVAKLFLDQSRIDSITVAEDLVEGDLNMSINKAIREAGSEKALEEYFKKSMLEIRQDIRKVMLEQEIVRQVQSNIAEGISITPNEAKRYFNGIPKDSLPVIPAKVQISIIQLDPPQNEENKAEARQKLLGYRSEILGGKSFSVLAILYSEDTESAKNGGEIGYLTRGELEKEYADAAFSLTKNTVSRIVETRFGFHIIQAIDRRGDLLNTRHILIRPKVKPEQAAEARLKLDSLTRLIRKDSLKFEDAALRFSTHKDSRINGGKFVSNDPSSRVTWFTLDELNQEMYGQVRGLKPGEISEPFRTTDEAGNVVFRVVKLDDEIPAHRANLKDDYQIISDAALNSKRQKTYTEWIDKKIQSTYIKISNELRSCEFLKDGWLK